MSGRNDQGLLEGDFVPVERYKKLQKVVEKLNRKIEGYIDRAASLEEAYNAAMTKAGKLEYQLASHKTYKGRNKIKTKDFDGYDRLNNEALITWIKWTVFPYHKFLDESWSEFDITNPLGFTLRLLKEVDIPEDVITRDAFDNSVVPLFNRGLCQKRSNTNSGVRKMCLGEWRS